jgi:hypothetical protein
MGKKIEAANQTPISSNDWKIIILEKGVSPIL